MSAAGNSVAALTEEIFWVDTENKDEDLYWCAALTSPGTTGKDNADLSSVIHILVISAPKLSGVASSVLMLHGESRIGMGVKVPVDVAAVNWGQKIFSRTYATTFLSSFSIL